MSQTTPGMFHLPVQRLKSSGDSASTPEPPLQPADTNVKSQDKANWLKGIARHRRPYHITT